MNNLLDNIILDDDLLSSNDETIKEIIIDDKYEKNIIIDISEQINRKIYNNMILVNIILFHILIIIFSCVYITNNLNTLSYLSIMLSIIIIYLTSLYFLYNRIIEYISMNNTLLKIKSLIDYCYNKYNHKKNKSRF